MIIESLKLKNFRNYDDLTIQFSPEINFITGENGAGKTNIIEAISLVSNLKSFRGAADYDIINWNSTTSYCCSRVAGDEYSKFEIGILKEGKGSKKKIKIDDSSVKKVSDYYGKLLTVIFSPSDINIINGTPDIKRRYFDSVISKIYPEYIDELNNFRGVLASRNAVLKKIRDGLSDIRELDIWDRLFTEKALTLYKKRSDFTEIYNTFFSAVYSEISSEDQAISFKYEPLFNKESFFEDIVKYRKSDIKRGTTVSGPQRDDYIIQSINGSDFNSYASQGQRRTAAVAMKISEFEVIKKYKNKKSVILVDDIFSELDEKRQHNMLELLTGKGQLIFTMVNSHRSDSLETGTFKKFYVKKGILSETEEGPII